MMVLWTAPGGSGTAVPLRVQCTPCAIQVPGTVFRRLCLGIWYTGILSQFLSYIFQHLPQLGQLQYLHYPFSCKVPPELSSDPFPS